MMWDLWQERAKPLMPVIVINDIEEAVPMAKALVDGGVKLLEITLRTPHALEAIKRIRAEVPEAILGVGTVTTPKQLDDAIEAGVEFAVSPGATDTLLKAAQQWSGAFVPGVGTPSEMMRAAEYGFTHMKLFPAMASGGKAMLNSVSGPLPQLRFCPTGGIGAETYREFLALKNVFAVGGSWLTPQDLVSARNWQAISRIAAAS
ncbi:MAG: bifunctional 4-hydroxy-2-oxoglutarate aldolase/2-dehydro-3-deoxy-phosphogluconate aldolase [Oleibacter sp.]|nr:bifunctional 4-hydroxy-2-oxoglutarate aldolase/2-dehydro-3-deoxy-phosphogluconate aldolase [Thalassolituus sp.]